VRPDQKKIKKKEQIKKITHNHTTTTQTHHKQTKTRDTGRRAEGKARTHVINNAGKKTKPGTSQGQPPGDAKLSTTKRALKRKRKKNKKKEGGCSKFRRSSRRGGSVATLDENAGLQKDIGADGLEGKNKKKRKKERPTKGVCRA